MKTGSISPEIAAELKKLDPERKEIRADPTMDFSRDRAYLKLAGNELRFPGPEDIPYLAQFAIARIRAIMAEARQIPDNPNNQQTGTK